MFVMASSNCVGLIPHPFHLFVRQVPQWLGNIRQVREEVWQVLGHNTAGTAFPLRQQAVASQWWPVFCQDLHERPHRWPHVK